MLYSQHLYCRISLCCTKSTVNEVFLEHSNIALMLGCISRTPFVPAVLSPENHQWITRKTLPTTQNCLASWRWQKVSFSNLSLLPKLESTETSMLISYCNEQWVSCFDKERKGSERDTRYQSENSQSLEMWECFKNFICSFPWNLLDFL